MKLLGNLKVGWYKLTRTNYFVKFFKWRVWWNRLPITHDALCVNNVTRQHGASVHGKGQNMYGFLAAINFHVRAGGLIRQASRSFLRPLVIQNTPKAANVSRFFYRIGVDVISARVVRANLGPIGACMT